MASIRDFNDVIVFFSIICQRNFTRVKKKIDLFSSVKFDDIFLEL